MPCSVSRDSIHRIPSRIYSCRPPLFPYRNHQRAAIHAFLWNAPPEICFSTWIAEKKHLFLSQEKIFVTPRQSLTTSGRSQISIYSGRNSCGLFIIDGKCPRTDFFHNVMAGWVPDGYFHPTSWESCLKNEQTPANHFAGAAVQLTTYEDGEILGGWSALSFTASGS